MYKFNNKKIKKMRKYINKPTDAYVSDLTSFIDDSMVAMTKCMVNVAKDRITKEINSDYPDAETIAKEGKFLEDASNYIDAVRDFDNIKRVRSLKKYENLKKQLTEKSGLMRQEFGDRETMKAVIEDMFSDCKLRKDCIACMVTLVFGKA